MIGGERSEDRPAGQEPGMTEMPALPPEGEATPTPTPEEPPLDIHKP